MPRGAFRRKLHEQPRAAVEHMISSEPRPFFASAGLFKQVHFSHVLEGQEHNPTSSNQNYIGSQFAYDGFQNPVATKRASKLPIKEECCRSWKANMSVYRRQNIVYDWLNSQRTSTKRIRQTV